MQPPHGYARHRQHITARQAHVPLNSELPRLAIYLLTPSVSISIPGQDCSGSELREGDAQGKLLVTLCKFIYLQVIHCN